MAKTIDEDSLFGVFLYAVQSPVVSNGSPLRLRDVPPLNFAAVCRSWRTVASAYPSLWTDIRVTHKYTDRMTKMHVSLLTFVKLRLLKSKTAPVNLDFRIHAGSAHVPICEGILELFFSNQGRWRDIKIEVHCIAVHRPPTIQLSHFLTSLDVDAGVYGLAKNEHINHMVVDLSHFTKTCERAAQLSRMNLKLRKDVRWRLPDQRNLLHLPNLSELTFCTQLSPDFDATLAILSACPNLSKLDFEDSSERFLGIRPSTARHCIVILPRLVELRVASLISGDAAFHIINMISCPSLLSFTICAPDHQPVASRDLHVLASFFSRHAHPSGPLLVKIALDYSCTSGLLEEIEHPGHVQALMELLRPLRRLEVVNLHGIVVNDRLVERLTMRLDNNDITLLCPSLSALSLRNDGSTGLSVLAVEEMLVSRLQGGKPLLEISLEAPAFNDLEVYSERLAGLVDRGLQINLFEPRMIF